MYDGLYMGMTVDVVVLYFGVVRRTPPHLSKGVYGFGNLKSQDMLN